MANDNIGIPLEIEAKLFDQLDKLIGGLEQIQGISKQAGDNLSKSFDTGGANEQLAKLTGELKNQKKVVDDLAASTAKVFDGKNSQGSVKAAQEVVKGLKGSEAELEKIYQQLSDLDKKGQDLIKNVSKAADAGDTQGIQNLVKQFSDGLDPEQAQVFAEEIEAGMKRVDSAIETPVAELRRLRSELAQGVYDGEELVVARTRAAELQDTISKTNNTIKILANEGRGLEAAFEAVEVGAGAFSTIQSAAVLAGVETEDFEKVLLKLEATQGILNGLMAIRNTLLEQSKLKIVALEAIEKARNFVLDQATGKIKAANVAMLASVGGAVIAGIALLVANWDKIKEAVSGVTAQQKVYNDLNAKSISSASEEVGVLQSRLAVIKANWENDAERVAQIKELQKDYPGYLGNIDAETVSLGTLTANVEKITKAYVIQAKVKASQALLTEKYSEMFEIENRNIEENLSGFQKFAKGFGDLVGAGGVATLGFASAANQNKDELLKVKQEEIDSIIKFNTQAREEEAKLGGDPDVINANAEAAAKAREDGRKKALAAQEKQNAELLKLREKFNQDFQALLDEADQSEIDSLSGEDKILAELALNDSLLSIKEQALKETLAQVETNGDVRLEKERQIEAAIAEERANILSEANKQLAELSTQQAIERANTSREALDREEQILLANEATKLNLQRSSFATEEAFENEKQSRLLAIQLQFAQRRLELLGGNLTEEQKLEKAKLEETISELQNSIDGLKPQEKADSGNFLQNLLGLDDKQFGELQGAFQQAKEATMQFMNEIFAARVADLDREIELRDQNLADLEERLQTEQALKEDGKANSVALIQAEIEEEKKRRDEALKEKQKVQARQIKLDAAIQASALITATAQIIAAESTKGLVGIITAGSAIISMLALIASTKNKIRAATQARHGHFRVLGGNRHENGGTMVMSDLEAEKDEGLAIYSREAMQHYGANNLRAFTMMINKRAVPFQSSHPSPAGIRSFQKASAELENSRADNKALKYLSKLEDIQGDISEMKSKLNNMPDEVLNLPDGRLKVVKGNQVTYYKKAQ